MTATELQRIARMLGNQSWCRYWMHWNHPTERPWEMAISCVEMRLSDSGNVMQSLPAPVDGLKEKGFRPTVVDGLIYYIIERTDENGAPFRLEKP